MTIMRVSTTSTGAQATGGGSFPIGSAYPQFSPDGTRLAFYSDADNLVAGDTNNASDVFVKNLSTGTVVRVSTSGVGGQADGSSSGGLAFSPDGTKVIFSSFAENLVAGDTNLNGDVFVKDLGTGAITRVSTTSAGGQSSGGSSSEPFFSPDGTKVVFYSDASNLVAGDTNGTSDVFVKNLNSGAITRVSTGSSGTEADGQSGVAKFSPDGTKVVFGSDASNLVSGDTNGASDVFLEDLNTGAVTRLSTDGTGGEANGASYGYTLSPDGTKLAFTSDASNLVAGDTNSATDVFIKDLATGAVTRVSTNGAGEEGNGGSAGFLVSPDGTKVAFQSSASNLVAGDTNGVSDVFVKDLTTGEIVRLSVDNAGVQGNDRSFVTEFSPDGTKLAFISTASNLVPGDTNGTYDVFVADVNFGPPSNPGVVVTGTVGSDTLSPLKVPAGQPKPGAGDDTLYGLGGNDKLDGGAGADRMYGGSGNDTYTVDNLGDQAIEARSNGTDEGGLDLVNASVSFRLGQFVENLTLTGTGALDGTGNALANKLTGNAAANALAGGDNNDTLAGNGGNDRLHGEAGDDRLDGGTGRDILAGGLGKDMLTGGADADVFVFGPPGAASADTVKDFSLAQGDRIGIVAGDYGLGVGSGLTASGDLDANWFATISGKANQGTVGGHGQFLFNASKNTLLWDADGAGGNAAAAIATLNKGVALSAADFDVSIDGGFIV